MCSFLRAHVEGKASAALDQGDEYAKLGLKRNEVEPQLPLERGRRRVERWVGRGSEAQWFGCLYPRLHRLLLTGRILEIALGFGRRTNFLISACSNYIGFDLSES